MLDGEVAEEAFECRAQDADRAIKGLYTTVNEDCLELPAAGIHLCSRLGSD